MTARSHLPLGKAPYRADPRNLHLARYLTGAFVPPAQRSWTGAVKTAWGAMLNDTLSNCTCACPGHMCMCWSANALGRTIIPSNDQILAMYEAVSGYKPGQPATDVGAVISDVLAYWKANPLDGVAIGDYVEVDHTNLDEVCTAIDLFGGVDTGFQMPTAAQQMSTVWTGPPAGGTPSWWQQILGAFGIHKPTAALTGQWAPGSWGGHCVPLFDYDKTARTFTTVSWGEVITVDWSFYTAYCDETWALLSPDWLKPGGTAPSGFDLATLQADITAA